MKKSLILLTACTLATAGVFAQVKPSTNKGGFKLLVGANFANISVTDDGRVDDAKQLTTFHAGMGFDIPVGDGFSIQPGIMLTGKGAKTEVGSETSANYYKATSNPLYIEVPVNFVGKFPLSDYTKLYLGAGPYAAAGIAGKNKVEGKSIGIAYTSERDIVFSDDNPFTRPEENAGYGKLKRFDYGLNALAGLEFNKFTIGANYGYGFSKINSNTNNNANDEGKNRIISVSLGVKL